MLKFGEGGDNVLGICGDALGINLTSIEVRDWEKS